MTRPDHVLIVDDDPDQGDLLALLLESEGHAVLRAAHGLQALEMLDAPPRIRLVILDLAMPVMDGRTFLAHKDLGVHHATPVIVFSSSPAAGLLGLHGVIAVISKGAGLEALLAAIPAAEHLPLSPAGASRV